MVRPYPRIERTDKGLIYNGGRFYVPYDMDYAGAQDHFFNDYYAGVHALEEAENAWQRAFDNVLDGVDEMIVSVFVNMPYDYYAGDKLFDRDEWNHSVKGMFDAKHHQWAEYMDMSTPWERWER